METKKTESIGRLFVDAVLMELLDEAGQEKEVEDRHGTKAVKPSTSTESISKINHRGRAVKPFASAGGEKNGKN